MITFESIKSIDILDDTPLGEGAFSYVYKVRHRDDGKIYAMKKIDILNLSKADCENLKLEIQLHQDLLHKNIIKFYGCIQRKNIVYMLLENAANGSLFFYIDIKEGLPELLALRFFYETALGIKYLHDLNIVHRDIKPENILLDKDFRIKVCDFGWSCKIEGDDVRSSICGTYEYMSPEIVNEESHDYGVDIWCLGILLFEMLHGNPPFNAENLQDIKKEFQKKKIQVNPGYDKDTIDLIDKLLQYDAEDRISIEEALEHRAIKKNLKQITRKLTQEEYKLLTRYYYMNSGGNQLMTHNSTYARQLKRQSMLTKSSHNSFRSTDSNFFNTPNSKNNKSDFVTNDGRFDTQDHDPLKDVHRPENFKNDFIPNSFQKHNVVNMNNDNKLANSAFKKKTDNVEVQEEISPFTHNKNKVTERVFKDFPKNQELPRNVNATVMEKTPNSEVVLESNTGPNLQYQNALKLKDLSGGKNKTGKSESKNKNNKNKNKTRKEESGVKPKQVTKKPSQKKLTKIIDPLKIANENLIKRNLSKSPKGHTTLEEFQKKYNPEVFKQKFQKKQENPKSPSTQKQIPQNNLTSKSKNTSPINNLAQNRGYSQGQEILSARTPMTTNRTKNTGLPTKGVHNVRTISKSPSTGNFNVGRTKFTNLRDAIKTNQDHVKGNKVVVENVKKVETKADDKGSGTRKKVMSNVTSISQHPGSIFSGILTKNKGANNVVKKSNDYKSTNARTTSQTPTSIIKNYKSDIKNETIKTTTTQIRKHLVRTEVQKVRATGNFPGQFTQSSQEKNHVNNVTHNNVSLGTNAKNLKSLVTKNKGNTNTITTRRNQQTVNKGGVRTSQNDVLNQTAYVINTYDDRERDPVKERYSLGVRSRTAELRNTQPTNKILELISLDTQKTTILESDNNKTKLSRIFEEPSPLKTQQTTKPGSLFQHLKENKKNERFVTIQQIGERVSRTHPEKPNIRSKSSDTRIKDVSDNVRGKFNKRVVYVNGKKTEKFIYSKNSNKSEQKENPQKPQKSIQTFDSTNGRISETTRVATNIVKSPIVKSPVARTPLINKSPAKVETTEIQQENKNSKDEQNKKKYKVVTVPKVNARVHQEGGLQFSNIKPITVIQQGTFALSRTQTSTDNPNGNTAMNTTSMTVADDRKSSTRVLDAHTTPRNASISARKKSVERVEIPTKEGEDKSGKGARETSAKVKTVISYQEYKRRIQKSLQENEKKSVNNEKDNQAKSVRDRSRDDPNKNNIKNIKLTNNPMNNPKQNVSKTPGLNPYIPPQPESTIITLNPPKDNIDTLVRKLEKINHVNQNQIITKANTARPISLNKLIHQVNRETQVGQNEALTDRSRALTKPSVNVQNVSMGHKKNKTMFNINEAYITHTTEFNRVKSDSSNNNILPQRASSISKTQHLQKKTVRPGDIDFFNGGYSKSSQRNYTTRNEVVRVGQPNNAHFNLSRPQSSRVQNSKQTGVITPANNVRVYANINQKQVGLIGNGYRSTSRRHLHESERNSKRRPEWQNVIKTTGTIKQSNSVKRNQQQERTTSLQRKPQVYKTMANGYTGNNYVLKGNVTTTIRRYTVNPSPKKGGERFKSPTGGNTNRTNFVAQMGQQKKQIFSDLSELKKNLKTTTYYQNT